MVAMLGACGGPSDTRNQLPEPTPAATDNFDWLLGNWTRVNEKPELETFEQWEKRGTNEYHGVGFTMQQGDTLSWENMHLSERDGRWTFAVSLKNDTTTTVFELIRTDSASFTCTNDSNEFPKQIDYWMENGDLRAEISGGGISVPFEFEQVSP